MDHHIITLINIKERSIVTVSSFTLSNTSMERVWAETTKRILHFGLFFLLLLLLKVYSLSRMMRIFNSLFSVVFRQRSPGEWSNDPIATSHLDGKRDATASVEDAEEVEDMNTDEDDSENVYVVDPLVSTVEMTVRDIEAERVEFRRQQKEDGIDAFMYPVAHPILRVNDHATATATPAAAAGDDDSEPDQISTNQTSSQQSSQQTTHSSSRPSCQPPSEPSLDPNTFQSPSISIGQSPQHCAATDISCLQGLNKGALKHQTYGCQFLPYGAEEPMYADSGWNLGATIRGLACYTYIRTYVDLAVKLIFRMLGLVDLEDVSLVCLVLMTFAVVQIASFYVSVALVNSCMNIIDYFILKLSADRVQPLRSKRPCWRRPPWEKPRLSGKKKRSRRRRRFLRMYRSVKQRDFSVSVSDRVELTKTKKSDRRNRKARSKKRAKTSALILSKFIPSLVVLLGAIVPAAAVSAADTSPLIDSSNIAIVTAAATGVGVAASSLTRRVQEAKSKEEQNRAAVWYAIDRNVSSKTISKISKELVEHLGKSSKTYDRLLKAKMATTTVLTKDAIKDLLSSYEVGSKAWLGAVQRIANSDIGPSVETIYMYHNYEQGPSCISPSSTSTYDSTEFFDSDEDEDSDANSLYLSGDLKPEVVENIILNINRAKKLSGNETKLYEALHRKYSEDRGVTSEDNKERQRETACLALRPKFRHSDRNKFEAEAELDKFPNEEAFNVTKATSHYDKEDLLAILQTVSRFNLHRAANAVALVLQSVPSLREQVGKLVYSDTTESMSQDILNSIKECLSHHTRSAGGTRPTESESLVKHVALSVVFALNVAKYSVASIAKALGSINARQVKAAIENAKILRETDTQVQPYQRKRRSDYIRLDARPYIWRFSEDDDFTRLDTNHPKVEITNPITNEKEFVPSRTWLLPTKYERYYAFYNSKYYDEFVQKCGAGIGETVFNEELKEIGIDRFVRDETQRSCVDSVISNLEHAMTAFRCLCKQEQVRNMLSSFQNIQGGLSFEALMAALDQCRYTGLVRAVSCEEQLYTDLPPDEFGDHLKLTCFECAHGDCKTCGPSKLDGIINELKNATDAPANVDLKMWDNAPRQGTNDKGEQNTQLELTDKTMTRNDFLEHFKKCLAECIPHYHNIKWTNWVKDHDIRTLAEDACIILTDFGATTNLKAIETLNCATDAHLACCNAVVLTNRRTVTRQNGEKVQIFTCRHYHFLAGAETKGKKADHAMSRVCVDFIIDDLKLEGINTFIYWTDNAPHQYKCRQTFFADASVTERHGEGIKIIHRFAVVSQFKGPHDAAGKDVGRTLAKLEKKGIRSPNAYTAFVNLNEEFNSEMNRAKRTNWKELEASWMEDSQDERIANKGVFSMDSRTVCFVGETPEEVDAKKNENPDQSNLMILCDRTQTCNAQDALHGTSKIHEVCSRPERDPSKLPRQYIGQFADLMCACTQCFNNTDRVNNNCPYKKFTRPRAEILEASCATQEEAQQFINRKVIVTLKSSMKDKFSAHKLGTIVAYVKLQVAQDQVNEDQVNEDQATQDQVGDVNNKWRFRVLLCNEDDDDDSEKVEHLNYYDACWSMNRFQQFQASGTEESASDWSKANPHHIKCCHCEENSNLTCPNKMCSKCCPRHGFHDCPLKSHDKDSIAKKLATAKEKFREKFREKPELMAGLPAAIDSFKKGGEPGVKYLRPILLFCFDIVTVSSGKQKPYYLEELRTAYAAQPDKLQFEESTFLSSS